MSSVLKELKKRQKSWEADKQLPVFTLSEHCFDKQLEFIMDPHRFKTAVCSRRSGKSEACVADLVFTAISSPNVNVAYITLTRTSAKRIIWPILKRVLKDYKIKHKPDNSELSVELDNGSFIYISGAKDESEIEKFRGMSLKKVYIDECQSFRAYIKELVDDIIIPALWDVNGSLCLIGTPGPVPAGFFYECATGDGWSNHAWTILDNPWIKKKSGREPSELLAEERTRKGITVDDPTYMREALGLWAKDESSLVFKFNPMINVYANLPVDPLVYIFGIDIGFNDADAIAVLGYNYTTDNVYLVEELITRKQGITPLVDQIKALKDKYNPVKMVMDAGALGKKIQEEILTRHSLSLDAADKHRKHEFIELLNDDLRTGKFKAKADTTFEEDCSLEVWDRDNPEKPVMSDRYHSDITMAVLYGWREARHYFKKDNTFKPKPGTDAYMDALEAAEAEKMEQSKAGHDAEWGVDTEELNSLFNGSTEDF